MGNIILWVIIGFAIITIISLLTRAVKWVISTAITVAIVVVLCIFVFDINLLEIASNLWPSIRNLLPF